MAQDGEGSARSRLFVGDLAAGAYVAGAFAVARAQVRQTKRGKPYLALTLADRTGQIEARRWDPGADEIEQLPAFKVVSVSGRVEEYDGQLQIVIDQPLQCALEGADPADFLPVCQTPLSCLAARLDEIVALVRDRHLAALLQSVFYGDSALRAAFLTAPAASAFHHAYLGGLLQHTLEVADLGIALAARRRSWEKRYPGAWGGPVISPDLVIAGCLLHDIGKIDELGWSDLRLEYTRRGRLFGHLALGQRIVSAKIDGIGGFPDALGDALLHIVASHHGKAAWGSSVAPAFLEAAIVHQADLMDVEMAYFHEAASGARAQEFVTHRGLEGPAGGSRWIWTGLSAGWSSV